MFSYPTQARVHNLDNIPTVINQVPSIPSRDCGKYSQTTRKIKQHKLHLIFLPYPEATPKSTPQESRCLYVLAVNLWCNFVCSLKISSVKNSFIMIIFPLKFKFPLCYSNKSDKSSRSINHKMNMMINHHLAHRQTRKFHFIFAY